MGKIVTIQWKRKIYTNPSDKCVMKGYAQKWLFYNCYFLCVSVLSKHTWLLKEGFFFNCCCSCHLLLLPSKLSLMAFHISSERLAGRKLINREDGKSLRGRAVMESGREWWPEQTKSKITGIRTKIYHETYLPCSRMGRLSFKASWMWWSPPSRATVREVTLTAFDGEQEHTGMCPKEKGQDPKTAGRCVVRETAGGKGVFYPERWQVRDGEGTWESPLNIWRTVIQKTVGPECRTRSNRWKFGGDQI